ncbi:MAG: hypothetical protein IKP10_05135 [Clostridia bacterium]|nr:hypothetical protein [Clostridia bacterium]
MTVLAGDEAAADAWLPELNRQMDDRFIEVSGTVSGLTFAQAADALSDGSLEFGGREAPELVVVAMYPGANGDADLVRGSAARILGSLTAQWPRSAVALVLQADPAGGTDQAYDDAMESVKAAAQGIPGIIVVDLRDPALTKEEAAELFAEKVAAFLENR